MDHFNYDDLKEKQPEPDFLEVELKGPSIYLRFKVSRQRMSRVMEFIFKEAVEANGELKTAKNQPWHERH